MFVSESLFAESYLKHARGDVRPPTLRDSVKYVDEPMRLLDENSVLRSYWSSARAIDREEQGEWTVQKLGTLKRNGILAQHLHAKQIVQIMCEGE